MSKHIILIVQILIVCHATLSKDIPQQKNDPFTDQNDLYDKSETRCLIFIDNTLEQRSIGDLWNNIKQTAINAWNAIKTLAQDTKNKIKSLIEHVKSEANRIQQAVEAKIEELKTKIIDVIQNNIADGEDVKKCLKKNKEKIDKELKKVISGVTTCISDKITKLNNLEMYSDITFNDTAYVIEIEAKLNKCVGKDNAEECMQEIRKEIYEENNNTEMEILKQRLESRNIGDDILDAIVTCSTEGLIEAAAVITTTTLEIFNCILDRKNNMS